MSSKNNFENKNTTETVIEYGRNVKIRDKNSDKSASRHRILHTICVYISIFTLGWRNSLIGPTLPDLRIIMNEDLATVSWIFTARPLGGLLGALCGGYAYDRFNKIGVFVVFILVMGVSSALTPWCYHLAAMLIVHVIHGICAAALETAATADLAFVWKQKVGPYMQALQLFFSTGAILSPLVAEPFLAKTTNILAFAPQISNDTSLTTTTGSLITDTELLATYENLNANHSVSKYGETLVYFPYSMTSLLCLLSACFYVLIFCFYGNIYDTLSAVSKCENKSPEKQYFLSKRMKNLVTMLLAFGVMFYIVNQHCFIGFLMTFLVTERKWNTARGSVASSVFWISLATGRLSGIVIIKFISLTSMIIIFSFICTSGPVLFLFAVIFDQIILEWVSIGVVGFGMSVLFSLVFSWLSKNVRTMTGKMTSVIFLFVNIGAMVLPILVGYLMDKISQMWFIYSNIFVSFVTFTIFTFAMILFSLKKRSHRRSEREQMLCYKGKVEIKMLTTVKIQSSF